MYGSETEVFVHTQQKHGKSQNLIAEKEGRNTIDNPLRFRMEQNHWILVANENTDPRSYHGNGPITNASKIKDVIDTLSRNLRSKGTYGFANLKNAFRQLDTNKSGKLEPQELREGFRRSGIMLTDEELNTVVQNFDANGNGALEFEEFMHAMNSLTSPQRIAMIRQVYQFLQQKLRGEVTLENLGRIFDATKHPEVIMKFKTDEEVFTDYIRAWGDIPPRKVITEDEFVGFYCLMSGCTERTDMFEKLLKFPFNILL